MLWGVGVSFCILLPTLQQARIIVPVHEGQEAETLSTVSPGMAYRKVQCYQHRLADEIRQRIVRRLIENWPSSVVLNSKLFVDMLVGTFLWPAPL